MSGQKKLKSLVFAAGDNAGDKVWRCSDVFDVGTTYLLFGDSTLRQSRFESGKIF